MMNTGQVITSLLLIGVLTALFCGHSTFTASLQGGSPLSEKSLLLVRGFL